MKQHIGNVKDSITLAITFIALILSGFSLFRSCSSESKLEKINYALNSIEYRPKLKLSHPKILNYNFTSGSTKLKNPKLKDSIGSANGRFDFRIEVNVINIGNTTAKIVGWIISDSISNKPFLKAVAGKREILLSESSNSIKFPHEYQEIDPFDSCKIVLDYRPHWIQKELMIIHVLLLYENELDQLFDTYYWLIVETKEPILNNLAFTKNTPKKQNLFRLSDVANIKGHNNYSETYTNKERDKFLDKTK